MAKSPFGGAIHHNEQKLLTLSLDEFLRRFHAHPSARFRGHPPFRGSAPKRGGPMVVVERFNAVEIQLRSPPEVAAAA